MEVAFRLVQRETAAQAADAFLLFADGPAPLAAACARFGDRLPAVFAVRGGFLLVPRAAEPRAIPGAVRLRRLSGDLFVPTDADLLPALLRDETAALTRDRGLIVLPGGTVLAFDPAGQLPVSRWLAPASVRREEWQAFPQRPDRPDALHTIEQPPTPTAAVEVLFAGAPDEARPLPGRGEGDDAPVPENARPPSGSLVGRTAAGVGMATAGFLAWLGRQLGSGGLARLGGGLARRAMELVPRVSERLLGQQEAALRDVLRELQSGDVEKALRRAPPAVADPDRPTRVGTGAQLTPRDPRYSLRDLVGGSGGVATVWPGGRDVWEELAREYRRLAQEAAARGDHRRAAYLYGVLLRDLRAAANALLAGGLFRDAALLLRDKLDDPRGAADAFERAGDYDEALRLYERLEEYERAGDLLQRLGEGERAAGYYRIAAEAHRRKGRFVAAGDLVRTKAHRRDLAIEYFRGGWGHNGAEAVTCAERLLDEHLLDADRAAIDALWTEVEVNLEDRPRECGRLFNYVIRRSTAVLPFEARADLADRARLVFAKHLRTYATIGEAVPLANELFPASGLWPAPVGRDAAFAARARPRHPAPERHTGPAPRRVVNGTVTAIAAARGTFDLVVSGTEGIVFWRVAQGVVVPVWTERERVTALSVSARGEVVYAVTHGNDEKWRLRAFAADRYGSFVPTTQYRLPTDEHDDPAIYLQPAAVFRNGEHRVVVATPSSRLGFAGPYLRCEVPDLFICNNEPVRLYAESGDGRAWYWGGNTMWGRESGETPTLCRWPAPLTPASGVDWLSPASGVLEIAKVDAGGCVWWTEFDGRDPNEPRSRSAFATHPSHYTTACLVAPGTVAAATAGNEVHWLRIGGKSLTVSGSVRVEVPARVVALTPRPDANEVIAVLADGHAVQLRRRATAPRG